MKNIKTKKNHKKYLIVLFLILCTSVVYAIFTQELVINGTVTGSVNFRVYFAEAWIKHSSLEEDHTDTPNGKDEAEIGSGTVNINTLQGADRVTFEVTLNHPGDKVLIGTRIKNESSIRVKLNDFLVTKSVDIPDINLDYIPLNPATERLDPNGECIYEFVVEWDENSTEQNPGPVTFDIELDYEQDPSPDPTPPSPSHDHGEGELHTVNFDANGGTVSPTFKQVTEGQTYGVLPTPRRPDYNFVGWFTALENGTQVNASDTVSVTGDITLYAIWNYVGHTMSAIARVEPTCTEVGNIAYYKCTDCNRLYSDSEGTTEITDIEIPALGHNITQVARVEATCTEPGNIAHYKCTRCNKTFSDSEGTTEIDDVEIPALGHILTHVEEVAATCTVAGNVEYYQCSRCNKLYSDSGATTEIADTTIPALGHDYNDADWELTTAPLCDVAGVETRLCRRNCGAYETREVTALGHDFAEEYTIDKEATCTEAGEKSRHCTRCVARTDITTIPATGHTVEEYTLTTAAACETAGVESGVCEVCSTPVTRSISALGHDFSVDSTDNSYLKTAASCTQNGVYYKSCSRCSKSSNGYTNTTFTTAKLPHTYTAQSQTSTYLKQSAQCSGTGVQGQYYYKCANCTASSKGDTNTYYSTGTVAHNYNTKDTSNTTYRKSTATCQSAAVWYYKCQWCSAKGSSTYTSGSKADHSYTATCSSCNGNGYSEKYGNGNWYYCSGGGGHCIVVSTCSSHPTVTCKSGYTAIKYCSKCCKRSGSLYYPLSWKGSGKQCKWCGTGYKT